MYATYNIHVNTHNLEFLQVFSSRQEAMDHLKKDAESHVSKFRGSCRWITKKSEITGMGSGIPDGYYLRLSQKHANRIVAYELRTIIRRGYIYNTNSRVITKSYIYSVIELPHEQISCKFNINAASANNLKPIPLQLNGFNTNTVTHVTNLDDHINELKACLKTRRMKLGHRNPYLMDEKMD
ncbi:MAG: hypothetical protein WD512_20260 [Candidatus Paceibacterota bacterium]